MRRTTAPNLSTSDVQRPCSASMQLIWQREGSSHLNQGSRRARLEAGEWMVCDTQPLIDLDPSTDSVVLQTQIPRKLLLLTPTRALNALLLKPLACRGLAHIAAEMLAASRGELLDQALLDAIAALTDQALAAESHLRGLLCAGPVAPENQRTQMQTYLLEHLSDRALSMERVAEAFGMSRRSLYKLFEAWGTTPRAFVQNAKLDRACALLSQAAEPVSRIARQCGFSDPAHFSRAFQARHGAAPSAWRSLQA